MGHPDTVNWIGARTGGRPLPTTLEPPFAAIGDTTNLAARLQTYAAKGSIAIGANTYDRIRQQAIVRPLGSPGLKGKSQPVAVYELIGLLSEPEPRRASSLPADQD